MLEDALSENLDNAGSTGVYPYASGLTFHVDASAKKGDRISNLKVNSQMASKFTPLVLSKTYTVVSVNYITGGGDGYHTFKKITKRVNLHAEYAESFANYARHVGTIVSPPVSEFSTQRYVDASGCDHSVYKTEDACKNRDKTQEISLAHGTMKLSLLYYSGFVFFLFI